MPDINDLIFLELIKSDIVNNKIINDLYPYGDYIIGGGEGDTVIRDSAVLARELLCRQMVNSVKYIDILTHLYIVTLKTIFLLFCYNIVWLDKLVGQSCHCRSTIYLFFFHLFIYAHKAKLSQVCFVNLQKSLRPF